ncbi:BBE domain-containing protein [Microvirga massiliensis]|uniref:BBE domain-containing protein n=1 Tax=Microvirga massiliensis TaxID=1033741 RepID=UPI001FCDF045|nr:BBE domain-containing protein [Microvirga massiliensis]
MSIQATYGANCVRLAAIKARNDPGNLFRVNQHIVPLRIRRRGIRVNPAEA